jgi:hypothetical protein
MTFTIVPFIYLVINSDLFSDRFKPSDERIYVAIMAVLLYGTVMISVLMYCLIINCIDCHKSIRKNREKSIELMNEVIVHKTT